MAKKKTAEPTEKKPEKVTPFTWLDAVTQKKGDPMADHGEKAYPAFMVNRGLSYFQDTIMYASEINQLAGTLDNRLMYDYYMNAIKARRRFSKWAKKNTHEDVLIVMKYYKVSTRKAEEYLKLLKAEQLEQIREIMSRGIED